MALGRRRYQKPSVFKTKGGRPEWFFRARVDVLVNEEGKRTKRREQPYYVGYVDEIGKREAEKRRDEILAESVNKPQTTIPSQVKFSDVLEIYKNDHLVNLRETTRHDQESTIKVHIAPALGASRMCDIDTLAIQRWISGMGLAESTRRQHLALLKVIWNKAEEWGFVQRSFPKSRYKFGGAKEVKGRQMPPMDQIRRLLANLDDPFRAMAEIALYCGLRISEIRGLKWEDVGPVALTVRRRVSGSGGVDVPKNGKERVFDVRPVAAVLARLPRNGEWIFGAGCSYRTCNEMIVRARKAAGITVALFGWHHLRAACNTLLRSNGADSADRQAVLGHATEAMNAVYIHGTDEDLKRRGDLMLQVQAAVMGATKGVQ
jgi:integrase